MDLKTGRARVKDRKSSLGIGKTQYTIEANSLMSTEDYNTWLYRSYTEAANSWSGDLGTGELPEFEGGTHNLGAIAELLTDREYTVKSVIAAGLQQGTAGDRPIELCIWYIPITVGTNISKDNPIYGSTATYNLGTSTITIIDDWTYTSKDMTATFVGKKIPKNSLVFISPRVTGDDVSNNCSFGVTVVLEANYKII